MGTINHTYDPNQTVWVITPSGTCDSAVKQGLVIQVRAFALTTGTDINYDIRLGSDKGVTEVDEIDIFATLNDAVTEYETRLT